MGRRDGRFVVHGMLQMTDVTDERTSGRSNDSEHLNEDSKTLVNVEQPLKQLPDQVDPLPTTITTNKVDTVPKPPIENQIKELKSIPRLVHRRKRRLRRLPQRLASWFLHELPFLISPRLFRTMARKERIHLYLSRPEETQIGWRLQQLIMLVICLNIMAMSSETVDGPRFGSTDPEFPNMLSNESYNALESLFTLLYWIEFIARWLSAPNQKLFWKSISTWISLLAALAAIPKLITLALNFDTSQADFVMYNLRILRVARLIVLSSVYVGTKVLFRAAMDAIAPLTITLFFLITVVMVFATAIFYAEPCYDLETCTFTDIFNAGYYVMLTVATVGYGSQVPSMHNSASLLIGCVVMIFGTFYFSMPLAIIGIKYELAWRDYDELNRSWKEQQSSPKQPFRQKTARNLSTETNRSQLLAFRGRTKDDLSLERIEADTIKYTSSVTCDRFFQLSQKILDLNSSLQVVMAQSPTATTTLESVIQTTKRRGDEGSRALDSVISVIKLHGRVCSEAHELLQQSRSTGTDLDMDRFLATISGKLESKGVLNTHSISRMRRARGAITTLGSRAVKAITQTEHHTDPSSLRAMIWNVFEYRNDIWAARVANRVRVCIVVLSIIVFYLQTTPELQNTGVRTFLCQRNVHDYCEVYQDPGCFVFKEVANSGSGISVEMTDQLLDLYCSIGDTDEACFAAGMNFGSTNFPLSCSDVFTSEAGSEHVCKNRLCKPPIQLIFDMEPYWVYFEVLIGVFFTLEFTLRLYAHPARKHFWGEPKLLVNLLILLPFYVEIIEMLIGMWPAYSVVPTMPSFFTAVRVLKSLRVLKLGTHIPGARVLINTTQLIASRLMIPLFFLFLGCVVSAAVFFEIERGTECFAGKTCLWWGKNILTSELSQGLPEGKRVLVQNTLFTIITDMLRSTWFSLVSFTTVGYGDMYPRTSVGRLVDILGMIFSSCYTAMPLTLVGGQFYVCYELHAVQERRKRAQENGQRIKPSLIKTASGVQTMLHAFPSTRSTRDNTDSVQTAVVEPKPQLPDPDRTFTIQSMVLGTPVEPKVSTAQEQATTRQNYTQSTDLEITNHFFLMQKVFHEMIKDISLLNQLGIKRVNTTRKNSLAAAKFTLLLGDIRSREEMIEAKITDNMDFCVTACLNFATMIERTLVPERTNRPKVALARTNALLAPADSTGAMFNKSHLDSSHSRNSIVRDFFPQQDPNQSPSMTPMVQIQNKHTFKKVATLSKVLAGPILQNQKWAEHSNRTNPMKKTPE